MAESATVAKHGVAALDDGGLTAGAVAAAAATAARGQIWPTERKSAPLPRDGVAPNQVAGKRSWPTCSDALSGARAPEQPGRALRGLICLPSKRQLGAQGAGVPLPIDLATKLDPAIEGGRLAAFHPRRAS